MFVQANNRHDGIAPYGNAQCRCTLASSHLCARVPDANARRGVFGEEPGINRGRRLHNCFSRMTTINILTEIESLSDQDHASLNSFDHSRLKRFLAKCPKPGTDIIGKQLRLFDRCEVTSAWHFGPSPHIEKSFSPFTWRLTDVG